MLVPGFPPEAPGCPQLLCVPPARLWPHPGLQQHLPVRDGTTLTTRAPFSGPPPTVSTHFESCLGSPGLAVGLHAQAVPPHWWAFYE